MIVQFKTLKNIIIRQGYVQYINTLTTLCCKNYFHTLYSIFCQMAQFLFASPRFSNVFLSNQLDILPHDAMHKCTKECYMPKLVIRCHFDFSLKPCKRKNHLMVQECELQLTRVKNFRIYGNFLIAFFCKFAWQEIILLYYLIFMVFEWSYYFNDFI